MKGAICILILTLFFSSCHSDNDLNGSWVGDYAFSTETSESITTFPLRRVLTFDDGKYTAQGSRYDTETVVVKGNIQPFSKTLSLDGNDEYEIKSIDSGSLVLSNPSNSYSYVYRKLDDSLKNGVEIELLGKQFRWENEEFSDTIYFRDKSYLRRTSPFEGYVEQSWERINHAGFDILFIDSDVPYIITGMKDNSITLITIHGKLLNHTWTEIKEKNVAQQLL